MPITGKAEFLFQVGQGWLLGWGETQEKLPEAQHRVSLEIRVVET